MDAALVAAWKDRCQQLAPLAPAFTAPTLATFLHIASGWVLGRSRPAMTSLALTVAEHLPGHAAKHWTSYERFFYRLAWSLRELSRLLARGGGADTVTRPWPTPDPTPTDLPRARRRPSWRWPGGSCRGRGIG